MITIHKKLWSKGSKNDLFVIQVEYPGQEEIENIHLISSNNREETGQEVEDSLAVALKIMPPCGSQMAHLRGSKHACESVFCCA